MTGWVGCPATETAAALLAVAAQLERVRGWRRHAPAYS
jgi:hypothetical protein